MGACTADNHGRSGTQTILWPNCPKHSFLCKRPVIPKGKDIRKIALSIRETKLKDIATEFSINIAELIIEVSIDPAKLEMLGIENAIIKKAIEKPLKEFDVKLKDNTLTIKSGKDIVLNELYKLKEKIKDKN